jgi:hypothetical protein
MTIQTIIQYTQKMMDMTIRETLTALIDNIYHALARFGCGILGLPYDPEDH